MRVAGRSRQPVSHHTPTGTVCGSVGGAATAMWLAARSTPQLVPTAIAKTASTGSAKLPANSRSGPCWR